MAEEPEFKSPELNLFNIVALGAAESRNVRQYLRIVKNMNIQFNMGGANLELFKFGVYIFFPIASMYYFGAPEFYENHIRQIKFWPEKTKHPPTTREEILIEIEKLKAKKNHEDSNNT